ncbi:hypothetical protein BOQ60_24505, partial [Chryseobacterium sp. CH1]
NYLRFKFNSHVAKAGMDYYLNDKNVLGFSVGLVSNKFNVNGDNSNVTLGSNYLPESSFTTVNRSNYLRFKFNSHVAKAGMDYYLNDKNVLGFSVGLV